MKDDDRPLFEKPLDELLPDWRTFDRPAEELVAIAGLQKWAIRLVLLTLPLAVLISVVLFLVARSGAGESVVAVAVAVGCAIFVPLMIAGFVVWVRLALKLFTPSTLILLAVLAVVCGLGVVSVLVVHAKATSTLRRNGIRVGLLGARAADLPKMKATPPRPVPEW